MFLLLLLALPSLTACSFVDKQIVLYPIQATDIYAIPEGAKIEIPANATLYDYEGNLVKKWDQAETIENKKSGYFTSTFYLNKVAKARVE